MWWYWFVFISLMIWCFVEQFGFIDKKYAKKICFLYTCFFIFMGTIRWNQELGDWKGYYGIFNIEEITSFYQVFQVKYWAFEPFYYVLMRFIKYSTDSYTILLFFMALIANGCFYKAAVYFNDMAIVSKQKFGGGKSTILTTYLILWATSCANIYTVRTNMAVGICLISIKAVEERKLWKFILLVIIASMFHFVAIVFFIVYPIYTKRFDAVSFAKIIMAIILVEIIGLERIIPLVGLLGGRYAEKINSYNIRRGTEDYIYMNYSGLFLIIRAMANTILLLIIFFYIKKHIKNDKRFNGLFNIYIIGAAIQAITISYNLEFARVAVFFSNIQFFCLPYIFKISKFFRKNNMVYFVFLFAYLAVKMYSLLHSLPGYDTFTTIFT